MNTKAESWISEMTARRDEFELQLCDALDVKTSIVLVAVTFEATFAGGLLARHGVPPWYYLTLCLACLMLVGGTIFGFVALNTRKYLMPLFPWQCLAWYREVSDGADDDADHLKIMEAFSSSVEVRIRQNHDFNVAKSLAMKKSLRLAMAALAIELAALLAITIWTAF